MFIYCTSPMARARSLLFYPLLEVLMKKIAFLLMTLVLGVHVQAAQLPLFPEFAEQDAEQELITFCQSEGLECYLDSYDVSSFDAASKLRQIAGDLHDPKAAWQYEVDTNIKRVITHSYLKSLGGYDALKYFYETNRIKAAFGFSPDVEQCTEAEYCSQYRVYIFLDDGRVMSVFFDFND